VMERQAYIWRQQGRLEDAASETLGALEVYEKLGASKRAKTCKGLLQQIERTMAGKLLETILVAMPDHLPFPPSSALTDTSCLPRIRTDLPSRTQYSALRLLHLLFPILLVQRLPTRYSVFLPHHSLDLHPTSSKIFFFASRLPWIICNF
jgi:hypothetical protein